MYKNINKKMFNSCLIEYDLYYPEMWIEEEYMKYLYHMKYSDIIRIPSYLIKCKSFSDIKKFKKGIRFIPSYILQEIELRKYGHVNHNMKEPKTGFSNNLHMIRIYKRSHIEQSLSLNNPDKNMIDSIQLSHFDQSIKNIKGIIKKQEYIEKRLTEFKYQMNICGIDTFNNIKLKYSYNNSNSEVICEIIQLNKFLIEKRCDEYLCSSLSKTNENKPMRPIIKYYSKEYRRYILKNELKKYNLYVRSDSKLCKKFIETGEPSLTFVVDKTVETNFYYQKTMYIPQRYSHNISEDIVKKIRQERKKKSLDKYIKKNKDNIKKIKQIPRTLKCRLDVCKILTPNVVIKDLHERLNYIIVNYNKEFKKYWYINITE